MMMMIRAGLTHGPTVPRHRASDFVGPPYIENILEKRNGNKNLVHEKGHHQILVQEKGVCKKGSRVKKMSSDSLWLNTDFEICGGPEFYLAQSPKRLNPGLTMMMMMVMVMVMTMVMVIDWLNMMIDNEDLWLMTMIMMMMIMMMIKFVCSWFTVMLKVHMVANVKSHSSQTPVVVLWM